MNELFKKRCSCGKEIEGYNEKHTEYLLAQHQLSREHNLNKPKEEHNGRNKERSS